MNFHRIFSFVILIAAAVTFVATFAVEAQYTAKADTYQLVEQTPEAALFGDVGTKIGSPQEFVIEDEKAILEGTDENGVKLLDNLYLQENNIYPLQLKSVTAITGYTKIASGVAFLIGFGLLIWSRRKQTSAESGVTSVTQM